MIRPIHLATACTAPWGSGMHAETANPARLATGDLVLKSHSYDSKADRFIPVDAAQENACFTVLGMQGRFLVTELVSGHYAPAWMGATAEIGHRDEWIGNDEFYTANHPDAAPFELTRGLFTTVAACPS